MGTHLGDLGGAAEQGKTQSRIICGKMAGSKQLIIKLPPTFIAVEGSESIT